MDTFFEQIISIKKNGKTIASVLGIWFLALLLCFLAFMFLSHISSIFVFLIAGIIYGAFKLSGLFNLEYEYIITNGTMDVDKIVNKSKRVKILTMRLRNFEIIAPILSDKYTNEFKALKTADCSANAKASATYFAVYSDDEGRKCLLFDPSNKMIEITQKYCPDKFFRA